MKERRRGRPKGTKKRKTTLLPSAVKTSDALFSTGPHWKLTLNSLQSDCAKGTPQRQRWH